jgi:hypothetical protein
MGCGVATIEIEMQRKENEGDRTWDGQTDRRERSQCYMASSSSAGLLLVTVLGAE